MRSKLLIGIPQLMFMTRRARILLPLDLPGVERSALDIELDDEKLVIRGTRTIEKGGNEGKARATRPHGRFRRSFTVPANVAHDGIKAEYKNGVLEISLTKTQRNPGPANSD